VGVATTRARRLSRAGSAAGGDAAARRRRFCAIGCSNRARFASCDGWWSLMDDLAALGITAACLILMFAFLWALERV
jgi:hypothetical protein